MHAVRREVRIEATVERVWELITRPEHVRVWYAFDGATIDLRIGGEIEHRWDEHGRFRGVIDVLEPPERLGYRYAVDPDVAPVAGRCTHVLFELTALATDRTLLTVTESLSLPDDERAEHAAATEQGWDGGLATLAEYARRSTVG